MKLTDIESLSWRGKILLLLGTLFLRLVEWVNGVGTYAPRVKDV